MSKKPTPKKVERQAHLRWIPLDKMRVNPLAQREINEARVDKLVAEMELEQLGYPTVNLRDGWYYIIDGQHRVEALKKWMGEGEWEGQSIQCYCYDGDHGLNPQEEAEVFLKLNDTLTVSVLDKFTKGVEAGRAEECDIDRIVRAQGLRVSRDKLDGAIQAVGALGKVYRHSPAALGRALRIIRDAYGDAGLRAPFIEGLGLMCSRYNGELDDDQVVKRLSGVHGGCSGLMNMAESLRQKTGNPKGHCVAAAAVEIYNRGRGGKKLTPWWRAEP